MRYSVLQDSVGMVIVGIIMLFLAFSGSPCRC